MRNVRREGILGLLALKRAVMLDLRDLVGMFSSLCQWKHLIHFLLRNSDFCQPYSIVPDVAALLSALLCRIYAFAMGSLRPKSLTAQEGHCCSLIQDQKRDVAFCA
jgi:hypothetical protein